jgi:hypothetical protein
MGWLDVIVGAGLAAFGIALVVVLLTGGGTLVEVGLVIVIFGAMTLWWWHTSYAGATLRRRE